MLPLVLNMWNTVKARGGFYKSCGNRQEKKKTVIEKLKVFFEKYFGV